MEAKLVEAWLIFKGSDVKLKVLSFDYSFTQYTDDTGKPTGYPTGGNVNIVFEATGDTTILDWMVSPTGLKSGKIVVGQSGERSLAFEDAVCTRYHESFNYMGGSQPMTVSISISARALDINVGAVFFEQRRKTQ